MPPENQAAIQFSPFFRKAFDRKAEEMLARFGISKRTYYYSTLSFEGRLLYRLGLGGLGLGLHGVMGVWVLSLTAHRPDGCSCG